MNDSSKASPLGGAWSLPDTLTGQADPPIRPSGVQLVRHRTDSRPPRFIDCNVVYAGHDGEMHWWTPIPVIDTWILLTDEIVADYLPESTRIHGSGARP